MKEDFCSFVSAEGVTQRLSWSLSVCFYLFFFLFLLFVQKMRSVTVLESDAGASLNAGDSVKVICAFPQLPYAQVEVDGKRCFVLKTKLKLEGVTVGVSEPEWLIKEMNSLVDMVSLEQASIAATESLVLKLEEIVLNNLATGDEFCELKQSLDCLIILDSSLFAQITVAAKVGSSDLARLMEEFSTFVKDNCPLWRDATVKTLSLLGGMSILLGKTPLRDSVLCVGEQLGQVAADRIKRYQRALSKLDSFRSSLQVVNSMWTNCISPLKVFSDLLELQSHGAVPFVTVYDQKILFYGNVVGGGRLWLLK